MEELENIKKQFDGRYEVCEIVESSLENGEISTDSVRLAICDSLENAERIARTLAGADFRNTIYYVSMVDSPDTFIPGGGFSVSYRMERKEIS